MSATHACMAASAAQACCGLALSVGSRKPKQPTKTILECALPGIFTLSSARSCRYSDTRVEKKFTIHAYYFLPGAVFISLILHSSCRLPCLRGICTHVFIFPAICLLRFRLQPSISLALRGPQTLYISSSATISGPLFGQSRPKKL